MQWNKIIRNLVFAKNVKNEPQKNYHLNAKYNGKTLPLLRLPKCVRENFPTLGYLRNGRPPLSRGYKSRLSCSHSVQFIISRASKQTWYSQHSTKAAV